MGTRQVEMTESMQQFIESQKMFFVATATADSLINLSPKGMDSFRILGSRRVAWLNVTGSGNESAAHVQENPRMTIMFNAFEGDPMILRLYGKARVVHRNDSDWEDMFSLFEPLPGARQIFDVQLELVQISCGMGVPYYEYAAERGQLNDWAIGKGDEGIRDYWIDKNQLSLDGIPSKIVSKNM